MNKINCKILMVIFLLGLLASACNSAPRESVIKDSPTAAPVEAQQVSPTATQVPLERPAAAMYHAVYDPVSKRIILIGRDLANPDVWAYDIPSQTLTRLKDRPASYINCLDYNIKAGGVVTNSQASGATWIYDPIKDEWDELAKSPILTGLWEICSFVYDSESDRQIRLIGSNSSQSENLTLTFKYATNEWESFSLDPSPNWNFGLAMAYDTESDRILLWDARFEKSMWVYDTNSNSWEKLIYNGGPSKGSTFGAAVYVPDMDRTFFYYLDQFYSYDYNTNSWEQARGELKPGSRISQSLTYDPIAKRIVMYGGSDENETIFYDDLWLYDPQTGEWAQQELP